MSVRMCENRVKATIIMKMYQNIVLFGVLCALIIGGHAAAIKDGEMATVADIIACQIDGPDRDTCMKQSFAEIIPKLHAGLKAIHIPPLDPLAIENAAINYNQGGIMAKGVLKATVGGFKQCEVRSVKSDITKDKLSVDIVGFLPTMTIDGTYKGKGRFQIMSMNSKVAFTINMTGVKAAIKVRGDFLTRDGERYLKVTSFDLKPMKMESFKMKMKGALPDEQMNKLMTQFINDNWRTLYKEIIAGARGIWEPLFIEQANMLTNTDIPNRAFLYYGNEDVYKVPA